MENEPMKSKVGDGHVLHLPPYHYKIMTMKMAMPSKNEQSCICMHVWYDGVK